MLEQIKSIQDLKNLSVKDLPQLCAEIREKLIADVSQSGGHLASNLGVVELTVALHYVFDECDKIVWDVGHQCYVHKILTLRGENFLSLRSKNGISGFPDTEESDSDAFNTGHAGTAISAALGLAKARDLRGENYNVIAVVGDGSMTCGMTYEALNNVKDTKLLIVLNDNNMSIGQNVGSATLNMSKLRVGKYDRNKERLGKPTYKFLRWCKRRAKLGYVRNSYFDNFDLKYVGIIDGNEVKDLVYYFTKIKNNVSKPTLMQVVTKKGKGYTPAEQDPESYHSVNKAGASADLLESSAVVGDALVRLLEEGKNVAAVCAAMAKATGLAAVQNVYPDCFFDVGIAEEHAVTFAAGLAKGGVHPFVAIYSSFLQRSYDQILHDVAIQNLPVTFLLDRAGFVGEDGKTHQGLFDLSYLSQIPNLTVYTPATYMQLSQMIEWSVGQDRPIAIRYSKHLLHDKRGFDGKWNRTTVAQPKVYLLAVGARLSRLACEVATKFDNAAAVEVTSVKPLDEDLLNEIVACNAAVITMEENVLAGGFGQSVTSYFVKKGFAARVVNLGVDDVYVKHATVEEQLQQFGFDVDSLTEQVKNLLQ